MSCTREQIPPRRKRQHTETGLSLDDPSELQASKRLKSSIKLHSAEFYDSLPKVWLTRRALKELNRRTSQVNSLQRPVPPPQRVYPEVTSPEETLKQKRFARHGGPELCDLRGYPAPADVDPTRAMASSSSSRSRCSKSTRLTSNSTSTILRQAVEDLPHTTTISRKTLSVITFTLRDMNILKTTKLQNQYFRLSGLERKNDRVISEGKVMSTVFPIISGDVTNIQNEGDLVFTRLNPIANNTTVDAKPDFYDGARLEDIDKQVQEELRPYIIPTGHATALVAPNFFMEAKAPKGGADVAKRQVCYDGAIGARAMHSLQSYSEGKLVYDGNAYTVTSTYHARTGTLKLYTTHPTRGEDGISPEYHISQIKGWDLTSDPNTFRQGATAFWNARDWAQEQRDALITAANERARSTNAEPARTERMTYPHWLTTLNEAQGPLASNQDSAAGHASTAPSTFAPSDFNRPVDESESSAGAECLHTESSTFNSYTYNGPSDTYPVQESETPADGLALDSYATPATPSKRQHRGSERKVSKTPRRSGKKKSRA